MTKPQRQFRFARAVLAFSTTLMGACGIIYEYTLGALGNNLMGSSHEQLFVIIGIMLFAMGLGSLAQRVVTRDLIDKFLLVELALGLVGGVSALVIYAAFVYTTSYGLAMYGFATVIGAMIGLEIPLLIRIGHEYTSSLRAALSEILCMDYLGALIGALVFTYGLLVVMSIERIAIVLGIINALIGLVGLIYFWPLVRNKALLAVAASFILVTLTAVALKSDGWMAALEQRCFRDPIVLSETSPYQHIVLTKRDARVNLYINGHLQFSSVDEHIYHEMLVHVPMSAAVSRKRVLILGGGDGLALREVLRYPDVEQVVLVDLDPVMTRLASTHPDIIALNRASLLDARVSKLTPDGITLGDELVVSRPAALPYDLRDEIRYDLALVNVINVDADLFLRSVRGQHDVVIVDFPDPSTIELAKLYSVGFYKALQRVLAPEGVVAIQSTSPFHARLVYRCIGETLERAGLEILPYHDNVPSFGEWGWHLAWRGGPSAREMRQRLERLEKLGAHTRYLSPELLSAAFSFGKDWLASTSKEIRANTKLRPVILRYYREAWKREHG